MNNEQIKAHVIVAQESLANLAALLHCDKQNCYCVIHEHLDDANDLVNQTIVALQLTPTVTPYSLGLNLILNGGSGPCALPFTRKLTALPQQGVNGMVEGGDVHES